MSGELWTGKHAVTQDADAIDRMKKRGESQAALIFALLIGVFAALGIVLMAHGAPDGAPSQVSDCTGVGPGPARLACFDKVARDLETPFKGAPPPRLDGQK